MPLPLLLLIGAGVAGALGIGAGVKGGVDLKKANDILEEAKKRHNYNTKKLEKQNVRTTDLMDKIGEKELKTLDSFKEFSNIFEKIKNKPEFEEILTEEVKLPKFKLEELKDVSIGAGVLLGGLGGVAAGTAGGFAAAGAATAAVMVLGTASTGTAIASLSGVAATNATLAALGGGALAAGGGGMALGATVLGATTAGIGLLVGGVIFSLVGSSFSDKAEEAWEQMLRAEKEIDGIYSYLEELEGYASKFYNYLDKLENFYSTELNKLNILVERFGKTDYNKYDEKEKKVLENAVYLVAILYNMCKTRLVIPSEDKTLNKVNKEDINSAAIKAENFLKTF